MERVKSLDIFGQKYKVKWQAVLEETNEELFLFGLTNFITKEIKIALENIEGKPFTEKELEITFIHEVLHAILNEGAYVELSQNEPLVEFVSRNLARVINVYKR